MAQKELYNYPGNLSLNDSPSTTPIATAPEIPSSSNLPYYEVRPNYYPTQSYMQNDTLVELPNKSLPPLSQLLPNKKTVSDVNTYYSMNNVRSAGYYAESPSTIITGNHSMTDSMAIRRSTDYSSPTHTSEMKTMAAHDINSIYYQQKDPRVSQYAVPSSDLSMFSSPPMAVNAYREQHYHLPSPPTSVIDNVLLTDPHLLSSGHHHHHDPNQKVFSFVSLQGVNHKKRQRRKYHEVERLYQCNFQNCNKAYGTLNHLNAHISMQQHGMKRQPSEFKELRKIWRKQKKELKLRKESVSTTQSMHDHSPVMKDSLLLEDASRQDMVVNNYSYPPHYMSMTPYLNTQQWINQRPYPYQQSNYIPSAY